MSESQPRKYLAPSESVLERVDHACDAFQAAWRRGDKPRIEDFLGKATGQERSKLLEELLKLELELRAEKEEVPLEEYLQRFPEDDVTVRVVFAECTLETITRPSRGMKAKNDVRSHEVVSIGEHRALATEGKATVYPVGVGVSPPPVPAVAILEASTSGPDLNRLIGRFQLRAELGAGASGTVYRAYDPQLDREVALKVPQPGALNSPKRIERFLREAKSAAQLRHPHIVPVYDAGNDGNHYFIASAFIAGQTLAEAIDEGAAALQYPVEIVRDLAEALAYAHELGIVHRDVKPANIMLDAKGQPHLMDFGLAYRQDTAEKEPHVPNNESRRPDVAAGKLTQDGTVLGTPPYLSPEQAAGQRGNVKAASDQYSLGVVLYELLCGQTPFSGPLQIVLFNVIHTEPPAPRSLKPDLSQDLETICLKAMAKRPEDRYLTCKDLAEDLRRWLEGEPILARPLGSVERLVRWCKREPALASAIAVAVACLISVAVVATVSAVQKANLAEKERIATNEARDQEHAAKEAVDAAIKAKADVDAAAYALRLALAERELKDRNPAQAEKFLDACPRALSGWELRHLRYRCAQDQLGAPLQRSEDQAIAYSPDGLWLAWTGTGGTIKLLRLGEPEPFVLQAGKGVEVRCVAFSPTGGHLAHGTAKGELVVWDHNGRRRIFAAHGSEPDVSCLAFSPDGSQLAAASRNGTVQVWDVNAPKQLKVFPGNGQRVSSLLFAPSLRTFGSGPLLCCVRDATVEVWNATTWQEVHARRGFTAGAISTDQRLALAYRDGGILVTDTQTVNKPYPIHSARENGPVRSVAFSRDGQRIASADSRFIQVWDTTNGSVICTFQGAPSFAFSPEGKSLAASDGEGGAWLWNLDSRICLALGSDIRPVADAANQAESGSGKSLRRIDYKYYVNDLAFGPKGEWLAVASRFLGSDQPLLAGGEVKVWGVAGRRDASIMQEVPKAEVLCVASSEDGSRLAAGQRDGNVNVWDMHTGRIDRTLTGQANGIAGMSFSPDGTFLAVLGLDGAVTIWRVATGQPKPGALGEIRGVVRIAFNPNGQGLACAGVDGTVTVWNTATGKRVNSIQASSPKLTSMAFSSDGRRLAAGAKDGTISVWTMPSSDLPRSFRGHTGSVQGVGFSTEGRRLASASLDKTVKVWDADSGQELLSLNGETGFNCVAFSPNKRFLAAGHEKGLKIWEALSEEKSAPPSGPQEHSVPLQLLSEPVANQEIARATPDTDEESWLQSVPYLPPDTEILISLNIRKLLKSELGMKYPLNLTPALLRGEGNKFSKVLASLGFEPRDDLNRLVVALPGDGDLEKGLLVIQGRFNVPQILARARDQAANLGVELQGLEGINRPIWKITPTHGSNPVYIAFAKERILLVSWRKENLAIEQERQRADQGRLALKSNMMESLLAKMEPTRCFYLAGLGEALQNFLAKQLLGPGMVLQPGDIPFLDKVLNISGGIDFTDEIRLRLTVVPKEAGQAAELAEELKHVQRQVEGLIVLLAGQRPELAQPGKILTSARIAVQDGSVDIHTVVREEELLKAKEEEAAPKKAGRKRPSVEPSHSALTMEEKAQLRLSLAKWLARDGKRAKAKKWCQDIIEQYPNTKGADEAKNFLKELQKKEPANKSHCSTITFLATVRRT